MIQDILTSIAILGAGGYTVYSLVKLIINAKQKKMGCTGCSGCAPKQSTQAFKFHNKVVVKNIL
jgi:hypothetical protein